MRWHQAAGISACCAAGANAGATRCASPTGFSAAIPRGSVLSISLVFARMVIISRCFGIPFAIRARGLIGLNSSTNEAAALGASTNAWFFRSRNSRVCYERTKRRRAWRSCPVRAELRRPQTAAGPSVTLIIWEAGGLADPHHSLVSDFAPLPVLCDKLRLQLVAGASLTAYQSVR